MGYRRVMLAVLKRWNITCTHNGIINHMHKRIDMALFLQLLILELVNVHNWDVFDGSDFTKFNHENLTMFATESSKELIFSLPGMKGALSIWCVKLYDNVEHDSSVIDQIKLRYPAAPVRHLEYMSVSKFAGQFRLFTGLGNVTSEHRQFNGVSREAVTRLFDVSIY